MSTLLPGTAKWYLQPSPQEPSLLSFPEAVTATKAMLATRAALFLSASLVESQPQEITDASKRALCLTAPSPGAVHKRASCQGCEWLCLPLPSLPAPFPAEPLPIKHSPTPHMTVQGEENLPPEPCGEEGSLLVLGLGDTTTVAQPGRTGWVDG